MANEVRLIDANEIPWCHYDLENYHSFVGVDKEYVDEMPTIDPESLRPKGRWTENKRTMYSAAIEDNIIWFTYTCSVCSGEVISDFQYCPNCGAKMMEG